MSLTGTVLAPSDHLGEKGYLRGCGSGSKHLSEAKLLVKQVIALGVSHTVLHLN